MAIKVKYDGHYPCLCGGHLEVWMDGKYYDLGRYLLISGGHAGVDSSYHEYCEEGPWRINPVFLPKEFPKEKVGELIEAINKQIPHGCCGGCI